MLPTTFPRLWFIFFCVWHPLLLLYYHFVWISMLGCAPPLKGSLLQTLGVCQYIIFTSQVRKLIFQLIVVRSNLRSILRWQSIGVFGTIALDIFRSCSSNSNFISPFALRGEKTSAIGSVTSGNLTFFFFVWKSRIDWMGTSYFSSRIPSANIEPG